MKPLGGAVVVLFLLGPPAVAVPLHLRVEPGDGQVRDAERGTVLGTPSAGDVGELTVDANPPEVHLRLVRPPFESRLVDFRWDGSGWTWSAAGRHQALSEATLFSLDRRIHLNIRPSGWTAYAEVAGEVKTGGQEETLTVGGVQRVVKPLPQAGSEVVVPRAWSPPLLFVVAPGFDPLTMDIPRGALDVAGDMWPPAPLSLSPLYGPFSYPAFNVSLALAGVGAGALWWTVLRPRQRRQSREDRLERAIVSNLADAAVRRTVRSESGRSYALLDVLGAGSAAEVYEATCLEEPEAERVAIKLMRSSDETAWSRFRQEVQLCQSVSDASVVKVLDWGRDIHGAQLNPFLVMEKVDGETLRQRLQGGPLPVEAVARWLGQLLKGLSAIHRAGATHRDIKPENLIVTPRQNLKIMDLGAARRHAGDGGPAVAGTPRYMSPEHAEPDRVGPQSDVYAAGLVVFEMLTGRLPWDDPAEVSPWTLLTQRRTVPPADVRVYRPDVPDALAGLVMAMLDVDPARRPEAQAGAHML